MILQDHRGIDKSSIKIVGPENDYPIGYYDMPDWYLELNVKEIKDNIFYLEINLSFDKSI